MARIRIRTEPIDVYLLTERDAKQAREIAGGGSSTSEPVFTTNSFGWDGFAWDEMTEFESDWAMPYG